MIKMIIIRYLTVCAAFFVIQVAAIFTHKENYINNLNLVFNEDNNNEDINFTIVIAELICSLIPLYNIFYFICVLCLCLSNTEGDFIKNFSKYIKRGKKNKEEFLSRTEGKCKIKVIIINGEATSGKSTFINLCGKNSVKSACELSTIDFVKQIAKIAGWNGEKDNAGRKLLMDLKKALEEYDDIPNNSVIETIKAIESQVNRDEAIVFVNIREIYNIVSFKAKCEQNGWHVFTVLVNRNNENNEVPELAQQIHNYNYDYEISNNGTLEELETKAEQFMNDIISRGN